MANARPYTQAHAIVWVDIAITFDGKLAPEQFKKLGESFSTAMLHEGFTLSEDAPDDDGSCWAFEKKDAAGDIVETVHVHETFAHVLQSDYRGWSITRDAAMVRLAPLFSMMYSERLPVDGMGLAIRDVFLVDDPDEYDVREIFKENRYLPEYVFDAGEFWSVTSNWAVNHPPEHFDAFFSRLAVDSRPRPATNPADGEDHLHVTEITHRQQLMSENLCQGQDVKAGEGVIRSALDELHSHNVAVVQALLTQEMLQKIGLSE